MKSFAENHTNLIFPGRGYKLENKDMDYSELVRAVQNGDEATASRMCSEALPILKKYLISNLNASPEDAEDAVQRMFEYVILKIKQGDIRNPGGILSYMLTGSRHAYLKGVRDIELEEFDEMVSEPVSNPDQLKNLLNRERMEILRHCMQLLKGHYRTMCEFIFKNPSADSEDLAEHFDISVNNAWIRKHRVIKQLSDCAKNNL
jgi:DNA-directed RNA polymerase specialized sigma24 family protein